MSGRKRKYNLKLIRNNYSYTTDQIADLFDIDQATVRRWVSVEGFPRNPKAGPHLIHSSDLRAFLERKNNANRLPCLTDEVYCMKCREPKQPQLGTAKITKQFNKTYRYSAKCSTCNKGINRFIKACEWSKNHPLACYLKDACGTTSESQSSPRECTLGEKGQLCRNLTP